LYGIYIDRDRGRASTKIQAKKMRRNKKKVRCVGSRAPPSVKKSKAFKIQVKILFHRTYSYVLFFKRFKILYWRESPTFPNKTVVTRRDWISAIYNTIQNPLGYNTLDLTIYQRPL
jgi:hypothetical protein